MILPKTIQGVDDFLKKCVDRFGHMNKKDYEVALFHLLLQNGLGDKSDYTISRELRIPESRVKSLRYETDLEYQQENDHNRFKDAFYWILKNGTFKPTSDKKMQFIVKDKMLRLYILDKLESYGSFADSSFNSNIVVVTASDVLILLADFEDKEELQAEIKNQLKKNGQMLPQCITEHLRDGLIAVAKDLGRHFAPNVTTWLADWFENK